MNIKKHIVCVTSDKVTKDINEENETIELKRMIQNGEVDKNRTIAEPKKMIQGKDDIKKDDLAQTLKTIKRILNLTINDIKEQSGCNCQIKILDFENKEYDFFSHGYDTIIIVPNDCWHAKRVFITSDKVLEYTKADGYTLNFIKHSKTNNKKLSFYTVPYYPDKNKFCIPLKVLAGMKINNTDTNPSHDMIKIWLRYLETLPVGTQFYRKNLIKKNTFFKSGYTIHIVYPKCNDTNYVFSLNKLSVRGFEHYVNRLTIFDAARDISLAISSLIFRYLPKDDEAMYNNVHIHKVLKIHK